MSVRLCFIFASPFSVPVVLPLPLLLHPPQFFSFLPSVSPLLSVSLSLPLIHLFRSLLSQSLSHRISIFISLSIPIKLAPFFLSLMVCLRVLYLTSSSFSSLHPCFIPSDAFFCSIVHV